MQDESASHTGDLLDRALDAVCGAEVDALDEPGLTRRIDRMHRAASRLSAERARLVAELERRRTSRLLDTRERERERQQVRRELANRSNQAPAQAKLDAQAGAAALEHAATGRDFADGRISAEHVRLIAEVLDSLPLDQPLQDLEQELLQVARVSRPSVLGRYAREQLARLAPPSVILREERQHRERRVAATDTPDGGLALSGIVYGTAAETVRTALDAFRGPDVRGEVRTPAQRTADALEQLCTTALEAAAAPARHGVRPQVLITVSTDQLELGEDGIAHLASGEPTTLGRIRHLLDDCAWARVILAPDGTPIEASEGVRTVPIGLWRALLARDAGCTWAGCDAPASWCDVAHGQVPFASGGRLSPANAALLCRRHHRRFDHGGYRIHIDGDRVTFRRTVEERPSACAQTPRNVKVQSLVLGADPPQAAPALERLRPGTAAASTRAGADAAPSSGPPGDSAAWHRPRPGPAEDTGPPATARVRGDGRRRGTAPAVEAARGRPRRAELQPLIPGS